MADPFGVIGVISLAMQISQLVGQFALSWKNAPGDVEEFITELRSVQMILSETNTNLMLSPDFAQAFQNQQSVLLSQLGPHAPPNTETKLMLNLCQQKLAKLLTSLEKIKKGHSMGWERVKAAISATETRKSVENLRRQCQVLNDALSIDNVILQVATYKEVTNARQEQRERHQREEKKEFLSWLAADDHESSQNDIRERRQEGTGQWLLDSADFQSWCNGNGQTLFCSGIPGAGKTYMTSIIVDYLNNIRSDGKIGIAYLYCDFLRKDEQTPGRLFSSLLKQFLSGLPNLPESTRRLRKYDRDETKRPPLEDILNELRAILGVYSKSFILVDALDEADKFRGRSLDALFRLQAETGVNIFATSRPIPHIMREFTERGISLEIHATSEDVQRYLNDRMSELPWWVKDDINLQNEIKAGIASAVGGMFLLAKLHLDSLIDSKSRSALRKALKNLPRGSNAYDEAYKKAMNRILGQNSNSCELAKQVLSWIVYARKPLTTFELQHAIAVEPGDTEFDEENCPEIDNMVSVCAGLVTVNSERNIIRLVHHTVQEFFERTKKDLFPNAETYITTICLSYLSFEVFSKGVCPTHSEFEPRPQDYPLYIYAAQNWGYHARASSPDVEEMISNFLKNKAKVSASIQVILLPSLSVPSSHRRAPKGMIAIHLVAYFGLEKAMKTLLKNGEDPNARDSHAWTPLTYAARYGHETVVKALLEEVDLEIDPKNLNDRTPLLLAALADHKAVVKMLVEYGANVASVDKYGDTPLRWALLNENAEAASLLIDHDTEAHCRHDLFIWALQGSHSALIKKLLQSGIDLNFKCNGYTPLEAAMSSGQVQTVKMLLKYKRKLNLGDAIGQTSLLSATAHGYLEIVEFILEAGVDVNACDGGPLLTAARSGLETMVQLLLRHKAEVSSEDKFGRTPLILAICKGHTPIIKILLEHNANIHHEDRSGRTPLLYAIEYGHDELAKYLILQHAADVHHKDRSGRTPLLYAIKYGHEELAKYLILQHGADVHHKDRSGWTPLLYAIEYEHEDWSSFFSCMMPK